MLLQSVLKDALVFLDRPDLLDTTKLGGNTEPTDDQTSEINMLISCTKYVVNQICAEYITLKNRKKITTSSGSIQLSTLSENTVVDIMKVQSNGIDVDYEILADKIITMPGTITIEFAYQPYFNTNLNSNISFGKYGISSRVVAYGVVAEYYYINGMYDDATIWDNRFKNSITSCIRPKRDIKIKERLWL